MKSKGFFNTLNDAIRNSEQSAVNFFSAVGPWLAPLAPAYMSYYHMTGRMSFPAWIAWSIAIVVEILGLSAVSTIISFWSYNRKRNLAQYKKAPVWIALASFVFYLVIILTMNVMLDAADAFGSTTGAIWVKIIASGMLTLLSVPAAIILAVRTQHKELLDEIAQGQADKKVTKLPAVQQSSDDQLKHKKKEFLTDAKAGRLNDRLQREGAFLDAQTVSSWYGVSERTAFRWLAELKNNGIGEHV